MSLGRSAGWIAFVSLCAGMAVANFSTWLLLRSDAAVGLSAMPGLVAAALIAWRLKRRPVRSDLNWDGSQWQWQDLAGNARVALDLQDWMLLCFDPVQGRRRWIVASRASSVGPWPALRAALYARPPVDPLTS